MASVNELARQRKTVLRAILGRLKLLDQKVQKSQSNLRRMLARKRLVPESAEYAKVIEDIQIADSAMSDVAAAISQGSAVFNA